ncbi:MAG: hypothetical protein ACFFCS_04355 [Candidatus Hodarchaeota archaeon]
MVYVRVYSITSIFLWGIAIALSLVAGVLFYSRGRSKEKFKEKLIFYGFTINIIANGFLTRLFSVFSYFQLNGDFVNRIFAADISTLTRSYELMDKLGSTSAAVGTSMIALIYELYTNKKKFPITIIFAILSAVVIIAPHKISLLFAIILTFPLYAIVYSKMLFVFTKWTDFKNKTLSAFFFCGFTSVGLGAYLHNTDILALEFFPPELSPIFLIISSVLMITPLQIHPKHFKNPLRAWYASGFYTIGLVILFVMLMLSSAVVLNWIMVGLLVIIIFCLLVYYIRKDIKSSKKEPLKSEGVDILAMFSRPQQVSEEEITVSREKRICLVCKSQLSRKMYICPGCNTFYCQRCTDTLENMENECWVCNTPFNETKPVKPKETDEKKEEFEIQSPKSPKKRM